MNKKYLPFIIGALLLLVVGGGIFAFTRSRDQKQATPEPAAKKKVTAPVNVIAVAERPYIQLLPKADGHNLTVRINTVKKAAESVEYEVEYQTGTLLQGFSETLTLGNLPAEKTSLLGSCSAGGACTYHEDIQGGNILSTFAGPEAYAVKSDWRFFDNKAKGDEFSSKDAKFTVTSPALKTQRYGVVFNSPGYPGELPGTLVSELYALGTSSELTGTAEVMIRASEEGSLKVVGWDGSTWKTFETTTNGKEAMAEADLMQLYAVVK